MPLNLASPGILVREVDLTVGRVDPTSAGIGAIVAPFAQGPVGEPTLIENDKDLLDTFGKPYSNDKHYEHWMVASSYLSYGGALEVVRADNSGLVNSFSGDVGVSSVKIRSVEHYEALGYDEDPLDTVTVAARNPGTWGDGLRVGIIDSKADQILTLAAPNNVAVGMGITQTFSAVLPGAGTTTQLDGELKGIVTEVIGSNISVKVLEHISSAGIVKEVDYQPSGTYQFVNGVSVAIHTAGETTSYASTSVTAEKDWFDQQALQITATSSIKWNSVAERPGTSQYAASRGSRFDEVHVVVIDGDGAITANSGTILEKNLSLSKARDAEFSLGSPSHYRKNIKESSNFIFALSSPAGIVTTGFDKGTFDLESDVDWDQNAEGITFAGCGNTTLVLSGGKNYGGKSTITEDEALDAGLPDIVSGYNLFSNTEKTEVDFILMGSAARDKLESQTLANKCIAIAEARKDAIAFISPFRGAAINETSGLSDQNKVTIKSDDEITDNIISFFGSITSSSYAVFDSGYKYMFDRFNNTFRYVPLNGDIAGTCVRTDSTNFPWFSPAGTSRGAILNAVKLAYNPGQIQRDALYTRRVNPVIFSPGAGIILFGDKTGFGKSSAFDRINVRRLFIFLEDAISAAAKDQLFEFNDEITRTNFVNIVEPFLRDVQAKRGIFDFVVICDETNNTAAVIDNNEFVADIFIKPARSINFIGLTFVATRTGVSFEEVIGNV